MDTKPFSIVADCPGEFSKAVQTAHDFTLPLLPVRGAVIFPGIVTTVNLTRPESQALCRDADKSGSLLVIATQRDDAVEHPTLSDLNPIGVVARVVRLLDLPDGTIASIIQSYQRVQIIRQTRVQPYLRCKVTDLDEEVPPKSDERFATMAEMARELMLKVLEGSDEVGPEAAAAVRGVGNSGYLVNFLCANASLSRAEKFELLSTGDMWKRAEQLLKLLGREVSLTELRSEIRRRTHTELDKQQRDYFLGEELRQIQQQLGGNGKTDTQDLLENPAVGRMPEKVQALFRREAEKLGRLSPQSPDYNVQYSYLQTLTQLPWGERTETNIDIPLARKTLDRHHWGMEKAKLRILEHLAAAKYATVPGRAPILCLYGPPGVGKTSLAKSIAEALGRRYVRMSLGGVHDESEIRGHRRTYVGAMPGRVVKGLLRAGVENPLFVLDEIDKVCQNQGWSGDPQSALLEVLDPEQNSSFHDNYLDIDYDLSHVMFVATANGIGTLPAALRDRMELISVEGYVTQEKVEIARRHLLPRLNSEYDFPEKGRLRLSRAALERVIEGYTRESGVRGLEKQLATLYRKVALKLAEDSCETILTKTLGSEAVGQLLGKPIFSGELASEMLDSQYTGVATGLAWTEVGGEILLIETSLSPSGRPALTLTGSLGDVMKESAMLALEFIRSHAGELGISADRFERTAIHIHVPEGATPKDGPSAGITIATSLCSALTGKPVRPQLAMTGELTLRGRVLAVGGIREKILAAVRAGVKNVILCADNRKDLEEIPEDYLKGVEFHYVKDIRDVLRIALEQDGTEREGETRRTHATKEHSYAV